MFYSKKKANGRWAIQNDQQEEIVNPEEFNEHEHPKEQKQSEDQSKMQNEEQNLVENRSNQNNNLSESGNQELHSSSNSHQQEIPANQYVTRSEFLLFRNRIEADINQINSNIQKIFDRLDD